MKMRFLTQVLDPQFGTCGNFASVEPVLFLMILAKERKKPTSLDSTLWLSSL